MARWVAAAAVALQVVRGTFTYDEGVTRRELFLAQASYCVSPLNVSWTCPTCAKTPEVSIEAVVDAGGGRALVGYDAHDDTIFASFRGSDDAQNWINNLDFVKEYPYPGRPDVGVEAGFYKWYLALRPGVVAALATATARHGAKPVKTTGHSAGAGPAVHLALELELGIAGPGYTVANVTTFGSPRLGDGAFVAFFENATFKNTRVTHDRDIVPHLPLDDMFWLGYASFAGVSSSPPRGARRERRRHVPTEVFYDAASAHSTVCDGSGEDEACSDRCDLCTSVEDHLFYLNTSLGTCAC